MSGRKRSITVDSRGLIVCLSVHSAGIQDRDGAKILLERCAKEGKLKNVQKIVADAGYCGKLIDWVKVKFNIVLEIIKRPREAKGWLLLPQRWIVERTFAWVLTGRRLCRDFEKTVSSAETMVIVGQIRLLLNRIDKLKLVPK